MRGGTLTKKELVEIGGRPIIWHVMRIYSAFGFRKFVLPLGYEAGQLRRYFLDYEAMTRDFTVRLGDRAGRLDFRGPQAHPEWEVSLVDTGLRTDKASRIARVAGYLTADRFCVTYGDGVGDVDLAALLAFHAAHGKTATITAVHAAQVDDAPPVHEHPEVVIPLERQHLAALVDEGGVQLDGEVEVVVAPLVAQELAVDGEEVQVAERVDVRICGRIDEGEHDGGALQWCPQREGDA